MKLELADYLASWQQERAAILSVLGNDRGEYLAQRMRRWSPGSAAHIHAVVREPERLRLAIPHPAGIVRVVSPRQYWVRVYGGGIDPWIGQLLDWSRSRELVWAMGLVARLAGIQVKCDQALGTYDRATNNAHLAYSAAGFILHGYALNLDFADRGVVGIRTQHGLWCQVYVEGWPKTPPFLAAEAPEELTALCVAALSSRWFPGLPFTEPHLHKALKDSEVEDSSLEWHADDDIIPPFPANATTHELEAGVRNWF